MRLKKNITLTPANTRRLAKLVAYWNARREANGTKLVDTDELVNLLVELEHDMQFGAVLRHRARVKRAKSERRS